jgi:serine/threonine-protein kinase
MGIVQTRPPGPTGPPTAAPPGKRKRGKVWAFAVLLVLALAGGAVAYSALRPANEAAPGPAAQRGTSAPVADDADDQTVAPTTTTTEAELTTAPDLVGMTIAEAQDQLPSTVDVEIVDSIQQGAEAGTVVEQQPAAGEALDGRITLTVARDAMQVYLDEIRPVNGGWTYSDSGGTASMAGKTYLHSLGAYVGDCSSPHSVEYNLSKGFRQVTATTAIDDNSENAETVAQLEIFADNRPVFSETVTLGTPVPITLDLSGVLRLKIQWSTVRGNCSDNVLALGEATLFGLPGEMPTESTEPTG